MIDDLRRMQKALGRNVDAASATGTLQAKLAELLARMSTTVASRIDTAMSSIASASDYTAARAAALAAYLSGATALGSCLPDGAAPISNSCGLSGSYGSWTQISADVDGKVLVGMAIAQVSLDLDILQIQIGFGAAGSESVKATLWFRVPNQLVSEGYWPTYLSHPINVPDNTRIAVRSRVFQGLARTLAITLLMHTRPIR